MPELTICTIVSANYLPYARVLGASVREHHPDARFVVLLVDRVDGRFDPDNEPFELIEVTPPGFNRSVRFFAVIVTGIVLLCDVRPSMTGDFADATAGGAPSAIAA